MTIFGLTFKDSKNSTSVTGFIDNQGTLTMSNSTVSGNTASRSGGTYDTNGTLTLSNSSGGGGISNFGTLTLSNSTVSDNRAIGGGGIDNEGGTFTTTENMNIINSTISDNQASDVGGGILIQSSIQSKNLSTIGEGLIQANLTFTRTQHGTDKILSVNDLAKLFAGQVGLQDNGGPTWTYALAPGSPAIDKIPLAACLVNGVTTDQRGVKRPQGAKCDIGAYEYVAAG